MSTADHDQHARLSHADPQPTDGRATTHATLTSGTLTSGTNASLMTPDTANQQPQPFFPVEDDHVRPTTKASWSSTLFNLTNTAIGAGTLVSKDIQI